MKKEVEKMKDKKLFYMMFLVCVIAIFAYLIVAEFADQSISVVEPTADTNYSGKIVLNATLNNSYESNATNVTFFFYNATDGSLVYNVTFENSTTNQTIFNTTVDTAILLADDTYNLTVNATNSSSINIENSTITGVQIDNTKPSVTINTPTANSYIGSGGEFIINVTVTDSGVGVADVNLSNNTYDGYGYVEGLVTKSNNYYNISYTAAELGEGLHTLKVIANDTLNNKNAESVEVYVDLTAPTVSLNDTSTLQNWTWTDDTMPNLEYSFTDGLSPNASCELFIDDTGYGVNSTVLNDTATTWTTNASLSAGTHLWYVNCTDLASNIGSSGTTLANKFYLDVVTVTVVTPLNNTFTNSTDAGNVSFNFSYASGFVNTTLTDNNVSCELWVTNSTGDYIANGVNNTALNNTVMTITNNQSPVTNVSTNWTVNCTYNGSVITAVDNDYYALHVDNETPYSVAVGCTEVAIGADRLCTCSASDNSVAMGGTLSYAYSGDSTATSGTKTTTCTATDPVGLTATGTASYTVTAASSSSSSSGGGGSSSTQVTGEYAQETWAALSPGTTTVLEVNNGAIGITSVEFGVSEKTYGAWMKVERKSSFPNSVKTFSGDVYKNIQITKSSALKEDVLVNPTIKFKVTKTWLAENKIGKANVALQRYVDGEWIELSTTMGNDDGTYVHYTAETPGFSYFIIAEKVDAIPLTAEEVVKEAAEGGEEVVSEEDTSVEEEVVAEAEEVASKFPWKWVALIIVLIIAVVVLIWLTKKK